MLLHSAEGQHTTAIARTLRCNDQTVRNAIHDFARRGLAALQPKSSRPQTLQTVLSERGRAHGASPISTVDMLISPAPRAGRRLTDTRTMLAVTG